MIISTKSEPLLELNRYVFRYSDYSNSVLNNVQLNVYRREMLSIVGHNGAGKSTLAESNLWIFRYNR